MNPYLLHRRKAFRLPGIPTPNLWLDARDIGLPDSSAIEIWIGKIGSATWPGTTPQPTLSSTGLNSKPAVSFAGGHMLCSVPGIQSATSLEVFAVIQTPLAAASNSDTLALLGYGSIADTTTRRGLAVASSTGVLSGERICLFHETASSPTGRIGSSSYARAANTPQIFYVKMSTTGSAARTDGANVALNLTSGLTISSDTSPGALPWTTDSDLILASYRSGGSVVTSPSVRISEFIVYINTFLPLADIQSVESYLNSKWIL